MRPNLTMLQMVVKFQPSSSHSFTILRFAFGGHIMLIRKAAFLASVFSGLFGVSQADAACFGNRRCCQATPVVCSPCPAPAPTVAYSYAPVVTSACAPTTSSACCYDPCSSAYSSTSFAPLAMESYSTQGSPVYGSDPVLGQIQARVDAIDEKVDELLRRP
jgi:hypothetical protein